MVSLDQVIRAEPLWSNAGSFVRTEIETHTGKLSGCCQVMLCIDLELSQHEDLARRGALILNLRNNEQIKGLVFVKLTYLGYFIIVTKS